MSDNDIPIDDGSNRGPSIPVARARRIGDRFVGAVVKATQRDRTKTERGVRVPLLKPNGLARQELVVHCVVMPGTTMSVALGDDEHTPEPGEIARLILKGKAFGDWIEGKNNLGRGLVVGDEVTQTIDVGLAYDSDGNKVGDEITTQDQVTALRERGRTVGLYGPLKLTPSTDATWKVKAKEAWHELDTPIPAEPESAPDYDDEAPF